MTAGDQLTNVTSWLVLLSICVVGAYAECKGGSLETTMSRCFKHYYSITENQHYYSGVDVETLRSICNSLKDAIHCSHRQCPSTNQDRILLAVPSDIKKVMDICVHEDIFEKYARNQNCFLSTMSTSNQCFNKYSAETQQTVTRIKQGNRKLLNALCTEFHMMVDCVTAGLSAQCDHDSQGLVELLLRPSVEYSERCNPHGVSTTTLATPTDKPKRTGSNINNNLSNEQEYNTLTGAQNTSSSFVNSSLHCFTLFTIFYIYLQKYL